MARKATKEKPDTSKFDDTDTRSLKPGHNRASFKYAALWKQEVNAYEQFNARWVEKGNKVLKRYRDERAKLDESRRRYNVLWANINVMKPAIYSKCPDPIVERKFLDKDPIGRLSATMLERTTIAQLEHGFHPAVNRAVYDRLLPGRGQVWVRYEPVFKKDEEAISIPTQNGSSIEDSLVKIAKDVGDKDLLEETGSEEELEETGDVLAAEKICVDYIDWRDFYMFPAKARTWAEVQAVGKRVYMSKQECIERFGEEIGNEMRPDTTPEDSKNQRSNQSDTTLFQDINDRAIVVYEIWNKSDQRVYWISTGYEYLCDVRSDPYKLKKFFPCPEPLSATLTNDTLTPIPDYFEYQDQAIQIDELTQRIALLTKACKVAGAYNAANKSLSRILNETMDNQLIPVDQWAMFAERGGVKGAIDLLPLDDIKSCIETLTKVRDQCKIDLDQITGISDIIRGTTDSRETLGGLRLKNNNAGTRLSESQESVAKFCREVIEIMSELSSKHFTDETLIEASGILFEEELQPETVLMEYLAQTGQAPVSPTMGAPTQQRPQQPMPGQPPMQQPQQPQQNNIVPFPAQQPQQQQMPQQPMLPTPDPEVLIMQKVMAAIKLLREDIYRNYRISIETDSTIFGDKMQDRQDATEFVTAFGQFMNSFKDMAQQVPESMPLLAKTLQWATRKYRVGRDLESSINTFCDQMLKKAKLMAQNPQQSPEEQKAQAEIQREAIRAQMQMQNDQREAERQAQDDARQAELQRANDERQARMQEQSDMRKAHLEQMHFEMEQVKMRHEMAMAEKEHSFKLAEHETKMREMKEKHEEAAKVRKERAKQPKKAASAK